MHPRSSWSAPAWLASTARACWRRRTGRVVVLEAADAVGGRVRTDLTPDGFVLDRGFQVLFTAYPALRRAVDLRQLNLRAFDNGAAVVTPAGPVFLRDPLRHPQHLPAALTSPLLTLADRLRLAWLAVHCWPSAAPAFATCQMTDVQPSKSSAGSVFLHA